MRILILLLLSLPAFSADLAKLKIVVTDVGGKPIDRANVIVKFAGRSIGSLGRKVRTSWEMRSTQEGIASIPELPKGKVLIQVTAKNYQSFGQTFDVTDDEKTIEVKLLPPQAQYSAH